MNSDLLNKKIPTVVGLLVLLAGIGGGVFLLGKNKFFPKFKPAPEENPKKVRISNVSNKQFTVSWITESPTIGYLKYGSTASLETKVPDNRDKKSGSKKKYRTHYVTIKNLKARTKYYFKLGSGQGMGSTLYDNNGKAYTTTTGPSLGTPEEAEMISGEVVDQAGNPVEGAIVHLSTAKSAPQASLTDKQGGWVIFLNKARSGNLESWALIDSEDTTLNIEILGKGQTTEVVSNPKNSSPLPQKTVLGHKPYDFREGVTTKEEKLAEAKPSEQPQKTEKTEDTEKSKEKAKTPESFPMDPLADASSQTQTVTITYPETDGEKIASQKPEFFGKGPGGKVLTLKIPQANVSTTITITSNGEWSYTPTSKLPSGSYTLSLSYLNNNGSEQTKSKDFQILSSGKGGSENLPAFESTPSAQASPSPSPESRVSMPSTESGVPQTGTVLPTFIVFISGMLIISLGILGIKFDKINNYK